jgi:RsiW-degrading membrane proteinase PrsW (M82 family)
MTGFEGKAIVKFSELFQDTFKKHSRSDLDSLLYAGTQAATYDRQWRLPWLYIRVFGVLLSTYLLLWLCTILFSSMSGNVIPGVIFTGALVAPATLMVFFWEFNQAKNLSLFDVIRIFFIGGAMSLLLTFVVTFFTDLLHSSGSYGVGAAFVEATFISFTEEVAKVVVVFILIRKLYGCLISNGLLVGAIVGTGFAVFETMGYGTRALNWGDMEFTLFVRGVLSVGGHVVWAAISGAAIMLAQPPGAMKINIQTMAWGKFLALFSVPFVLHLLWDFVAFTVNSDPVAYTLLACLVVVAWVFIVRLINSGLRQYATLLGQESYEITD